jgi:protease PrsW
MRDGIILGAVVGLGFAALENAGYAFNALFTVEGLSLRGLVETEVLRGVLTPVGHGVWTRHPWRGAVPGGRGQGPAPCRRRGGRLVPTPEQVQVFTLTN